MSPASQWVSLTDLSVLNPPSGNWIMGVLKGYFDDSGTDSDPQHHACTVAGFIGSVTSWATLEKTWRQILDRHDVPYLHMKQCAHFRPPFSKWKHDEEGRARFLKELTNAIGEVNLYGVGTTIRIPDLHRFNRDKDRNIGAFELGVYGCLLDVAAKIPEEPLELVFDRFPKIYKKLAAVEDYASTDPLYPNCHKRVGIIPLPEPLSFKTVPGIQAADFLAWEMRKSCENKREWFEAREMDDHSEEWRNSLVQWTLETRGRFPDERMSCSGLLGASIIEGIVLDYKALCQADAIRSGRWSSD